MKGKHSIWMLIKEGKALAIVSTTIWNVLEKKETTGVLSNRY